MNNIKIQHYLHKTDRHHEDEEQGFQQQKIIIKNHQVFENLKKIKIQKARQIIQQERPKDYLPRVLYPNLYNNYPTDIDNIKLFTSEVMITQKQPLIKPKKYRSLYQKYKLINQYELVYSKYGQRTDENYLNSYLNLNEIIDYNPKMFYLFKNNNVNSSRFDSNFQSGNLLYAYQVSQTQFDLILQNDVNTKGYNQWFYFSFKNKDLESVKFNIVNLVKKRSLFAEGVRPVCYSLRYKYWENTGKNIYYHKSMVYRQNGEHYYTLSFQVNFTQKQDIIYFALTLPYTYSKMIKFINNIEQNNNQSISIEKKILCYSISNNPILYLTFKKSKSQKIILVMARQHPGQTVSSFVLQGFIKNLVKNTDILEKYQLIVFPMVNPDGVIYGNFRTNLSGFDLNRQWANPDRWLHPQIYFMKKFIQSLKGLEFVLDLHGHSKKYNSFIYGCQQEDKIQQKLFSYLMNRNELFNLKDCTYGITPDKITTARAVINKLDIKSIFTLQTSFFGFQINDLKRKFCQQNFDSIGKSIIQALEIFFLKKQQKEKVFEQIKSKLPLFELWENMQKYDSGSQSNPSEDQLNCYQRYENVMAEKMNSKKKKYPKKNKNKKQKQKQKIQDKKSQTNNDEMPLIKTVQQKNIQYQKMRQKKSQFSLYSNSTKNEYQEEYSKYEEPKLKQLQRLYSKKKSEKIVLSSNLIQQRNNKNKKVDLLEAIYLKKINNKDLQINKEQTHEEIKNDIQERNKSNYQLISKERLDKFISTNANKIEQKINFCIAKNRRKQIERAIQDRSQFLRQVRQNKSFNEQKVYDINSALLSNDKKVYRLYEPKKLKMLKPLDKSNSFQKNLIYLSELLRPQISQTNYLNIDQDIEKQIKIKNQDIQEKKKPIFTDLKFI